MGTIILMIAFVIEVVFATYCILTKSNQEKGRSLIRIGVFVTFVLFTLVSIIHWNFTWYLLALLLFLWALLGTWKLIRRKAEKKEFKVWRSVVRAITATLLIFIAVIPALIFPQHRLPRETGMYEVATVNYTYTDASRVETFTTTGENRKVNVEFWYPQKGNGKYPLVVFSHGSGGMKTSNTSTFMELASNGYVVCSIDHPYHSLFTIGSDGRFIRIDPSYWQEYMNLNSGKYTEEDRAEVDEPSHRRHQFCLGYDPRTR
jgi:Ca2+/Na+ antiporter